MTSVLGGQEYRVLYAHLSRVDVQEGQEVRAGQTLGLSGNTGNTKGPHLHQEVRHAPFKYGDDVNPDAVVAWMPENHVTRGRQLLAEAIAELARSQRSRVRVHAAVKALQAVLKSLPPR